MKFTAFKEFRVTRFPIDMMAGVISYLEGDFRKILSELRIGLTRLSFADNSDSFTATVSIASGAELAVRNGIPSGAVPTHRLIVRGNSNEVVDGDTPWTADYVYLKNLGASTAEVTVVFLRG